MNRRSVRGVCICLVMLVSLLVTSTSIAHAQSATWTLRANMPTGRYLLGVAAASNGKIYAIGGYVGFTALATVQEYDPSTNIWTTRASMPTARYGLGVAAASNGKIYAIGGSNGANLATVEEYDPSTNIWTTRASMPTARFVLGVAAASNGKLYAIGGHNGAFLTTVEEYDPSTNIWTTRTGMSTARNGLSVASASNGKLYAIGGSNGANLGTVEEYNPSTDVWTTTASMSTARYGLAAVATSSGKIYAIGGLSDGVGSPTTVEEFDPIPSTQTATSTPTLTATKTSTTTVIPVTSTATATSIPAPPVPSTVMPSAGALNTGTQVTIVGSGFRTGASVFFGATAASSVSVISSSAITATSPASGVTGSVTIRVVNLDGQSGQLPGGFTYLATPSVTSIAPATGSIAGGSMVKLFGSNLDSVTSVLFGDAAGSIARASATELVVQAPAHVAGAIAIIVRAPGGTVTVPGTFTFVDEAVATAQAGATRTAVAQATVNAASTVEAQRQATISAAQAQLALLGNSAQSAISVAIGGSTTGTSDNTLGRKWYRLPIPESSVGRTLRIQTSGVNGVAVDTQMTLGRLTPLFQSNFFNDDDPERPGTQASGLTMVVMSAGDWIINVSAPNGASFVLSISDITVQVVPTSTTTPISPTRTATRTLTPTATALPKGTPDQYESDALPTQGPTITVNGGALTRSFHNSRDIDHARFTAGVAGVYVIRTSDLRLGIDTYLELLREDGSAVLDTRTLRRIVNDDDPTRGSEAFSSRIETELIGSDVGQTFVVRITNLKQLAYGTVATYDLRVQRSDGSGTATPTATVTRTITPTRTPFPVDAYETDNSKADADRIGVYSLRTPIDHRGSQAIGTTRNVGPKHTFARAGDEDWLAVSLGQVQSGATLVIRTRDMGTSTIGGLKTDTMVVLSRPDANASNGLRTVLFNNVCADGVQSEGSCISYTFSDDDAIVYAGQTWYIQIKNFEPRVFGDGVEYSLSVEMRQPGAGTATSTPTVTPTPSITRTPDPDGPVRRTITVTPTPERMEFDVSTALGGQLTDSIGNTTIIIFGNNVFTGLNIDQVVQLYFYFKSRYIADSISKISSSIDIRRHVQLAASGGDVTVLSFTAKAIDLGTFSRIGQFDQPVLICTGFQWEEIQLFDQNTLKVYVVDPDTGERLTTDIEISSFTAATGPDGVPPYQPGQICFKTPHFSEFELAGGELPTPTPRPTRTSTPIREIQTTPTPSNYRMFVSIIPNNLGGW